jgi:uncharacterized protein (DUF427 family)
MLSREGAGSSGRDPGGRHSGISDPEIRIRAIQARVGPNNFAVGTQRCCAAYKSSSFRSHPGDCRENHQQLRPSFVSHAARRNIREMAPGATRNLSDSRNPFRDKRQPTCKEADGGPTKTGSRSKETKMVRAKWNGAVLAESDRCEEVEGNIYFPTGSVRWEYFRKSDKHTVCAWKGLASYYDVVVDGQCNPQAAWYYAEPKAAAARIRDHVAFWKGVRVD